ncbi:MAG TPA: dihydrofolate reductase family protein [Gemmatimonadales bacterium]|nr:dihydrofolate reductase family protein [Gemmatimonadales bacterium]
MRPVRYNVAASLDGFITDAGGGFDWIPHDPAVDFDALFAKVDTVLLGRRSWETVQAMGGGAWPAGARIYVFSRTLTPEATPDVHVVAEDAAAVVAALRAEPGDGEIWLFGGGTLAATLFAAGLVDRVEVTVVPVLLGAGTPLVAAGIPRTTLELTGTTRYPSGLVTLAYAVRASTA